MSVFFVMNRYYIVVSVYKLFS